MLVNVNQANLVIARFANVRIIYLENVVINLGNYNE